MNRRLRAAPPWALLIAPLALLPPAVAACGSNDEAPWGPILEDAGGTATIDSSLPQSDANPPQNEPDSAPSPDDASLALDASSGADASDGAVGTAPSDAGADAPVDASFVESTLTVLIALNVKAIDAGAAIDASAVNDGGDAGPAAPTSVATLVITARDGTTPVITDLWLYTLDATQAMTPLTAFTSTGARKTPRLMLPATIAGQDSGLSPADDGRLNGLMTNTTRGTYDQGAFVNTVNGTVTVTLGAVPTTPILVVAAIEDQRYAGAAVVNPDGTAGTVPAGVGAPQTHVLRSFETDVRPILRANCTTGCHEPTGADEASFYLVTGTRDDLVNANFALNEQTADCEAAHPDGGQPLTACIQAITQAQFLVEPGAPAVSDLLQRSRPDENAGTSALGLVWYGGKGARYNTTYGDRRMPSTTESVSAADWTNQPIYFDETPSDYQILFDWVAQGAPP